MFFFVCFSSLTVKLIWHFQGSSSFPSSYLLYVFFFVWIISGHLITTTEINSANPTHYARELYGNQEDRELLLLCWNLFLEFLIITLLLGGLKIDLSLHFENVGGFLIRLDFLFHSF